MKLHTKILLIALLPILILGIGIFLLAVDRTANGIYDESYEGMKAASLAIRDIFEVGNEGKYEMDKEGNLWKGTTLNITGATEIVDHIKSNTGMDVTIFWGDTRILTSIENEVGERQINTKASEKVIEKVLNNCYSSENKIEVEDYLVPTEKGEYLDMAFADVETFLYIRSEPTRESEWVGKLYPDYAAKILGPVGEWTKVESGEVTGYVYSEYIIIGNSAEQKAQEMVQESENDSPEEVFTYAESKEEEEARIAAEAAEAAARAQEEAAAKAGTGQAIVDYACQFIGNPYVWGGTSLTNGADCSGFVQYVLRNAAGVSLPRTSREQAKAGRAVTSSEMLPGDLIFYTNSSGVVNHVAMYIGNGQIVHAASRRSGIKISTWNYRRPKTIRRFLN